VLGPATESATYILLAPAIAWAMVLSEKQSTVHRIAYATVLGLFITSQVAVIFNLKFFRDHLQPLPFAATILLVLVFVQTVAFKADSPRRDTKEHE
jgi:hypothetical protein